DEPADVDTDSNDAEKDEL
ncbi:hypothetical protein BpHYR1_005025, partial [Brachionus plicatilis]